MADTLKSMTISYTFSYLLTDASRDAIKLLVEKIYPQELTGGVGFFRDSVSFRFKDYSLLMEYIDSVVILMNCDARSVKDDIQKLTDNNYIVFMWS